MRNKNVFKDEILKKKVLLDERVDNRVYGTTSFYFILPKEALKLFGFEKYNEAVGTEIHLEVPTNDFVAYNTTVMVSPTNKYGEDYDWNPLNLSRKEINSLLKIAGYKQSMLKNLGRIVSDTIVRVYSKQGVLQ